MRLDHVFLCCDPGAPEAQALIDAGLVEGPGDVHAGQGTANRRFFFAQGGFLELLWVHDESEARSPRTARTRLWERWSRRRQGANPYGLCWRSTAGDPPPPWPTWDYAPSYLPAGLRIRFAEGLPLSEPEMFVLMSDHAPHAAGPSPSPTAGGPLQALQAVSVGVRDPVPSSTLNAARDAGCLALHAAPHPELVLHFTASETVDLALPTLGLRLEGRPQGVCLRRPPPDGAPPCVPG